MVSDLNCVTTWTSFYAINFPFIRNFIGAKFDNTCILAIQVFVCYFNRILIWGTKLSSSYQMYLLIALFTPQPWQYMTIIRDIFWVRPLIFADKFLGNSDQFKLIWENCNRDHYLCAQTIDILQQQSTVGDTAG